MATTLTLVSHPLCPFVQRAAIILLEKNQPFERIDIDLGAKPGWFLAMSPLGKVPLLKIEGAEGQPAVLFESMAICEYLEETAPGPRLHPTDAIERARHRGWIEFGSAMLADAWAFLTLSDEAAVVGKAQGLRDKLRALESALGDGPFFAGNRFSIVDAVMAPVFRYFDVLGERTPPAFFDSLPRVAAWRLALSQRPSVIGAVAPDYAARFIDFLATKHGRLREIAVR